MTPEELKNSILKKAFRGQLISQLPGDITYDSLGFDIEDPPFEIPRTWKWQTLGNCCEMYTGNSISAREKAAKYEGLSEGYDYIATKNVLFDQTIEYNNGVRIPLDSTFKRAYKGSVLLCVEGGSAGRKIGILDRDVCFGNKLCSFRAVKVLNTFLFYYLQSREFRIMFSDNMTGIIGGVGINKLRNILIPMPPLADQERIVAKIVEMLPFVDLYEEAWVRLENLNQRFPIDMQKSILQTAIQGKLVEQRLEEGTAKELYQQIQKEKQRLAKGGMIRRTKSLPKITEQEKPFQIPHTWEWTRFGEIISLTSGRDMKPAEYNDKGKGVPYITGASNIKGSQIIVNRWTESAKVLARKGDLLLTCKGTVGKTAILERREAHIARQIMAITGNGLNMKYIKYYLESQIGFLVSQAKSIIPGIERDNVRNLVFPLPPLAEQRRIVAKIEELFSLSSKLVYDNSH